VLYSRATVPAVPVAISVSPIQAQAQDEAAA
jgi:hypothetical protein